MVIAVGALTDGLHPDALDQSLYQPALNLPCQGLVKTLAQLPQKVLGRPQPVLGFPGPGAFCLEPRDLLPQAGPLALDLVQLAVQGRIVDPATAEEADDPVALVVFAS